MFEYFFHKYMASSVLNNKNEPTERKRNNSLQYQTEASEEVTPITPITPRISSIPRIPRKNKK